MKKSQSIFYYIMEYLFLLILGGCVYYGIECLWRGYSHPSMVLVGGLCFIGIGLLNELISWDMPFWLQLVLGDLIVLVIEFTSGCILNLYMGLHVWDYSHLPFNLLGQICLPFAILWIPVVAFAIYVDDWVKYLLFHGKRPHYNYHFKVS